MPFIYSLFSVILFLHLFISSKPSEIDHCYAKIHGDIDDTLVPAQNITSINELDIAPRLNHLLNFDYFHFYEITLNQPCPFFPDDNKCSLHSCKVHDCSVEEVPEGLLNGNRDHHSPSEKYSEEFNKENFECDLGRLDSSLSANRESSIEEWRQHDAKNENNFCELDDEFTDRMVYVDLLKNPERFTGYDGHKSHRIWDMIYNENCFGASRTNYPYASDVDKDWMSCLEKRSFYRLISGLHSSISIHLCAIYPQHLGVPLMPESWKPNVDLFESRFDPRVNPQADLQLRNLYFAYTVELRALAKAAPYLAKHVYFTGQPMTDNRTSQTVIDLLELVQSKGNLFDERLLFTDTNPETLQLKQDFRQRFRNVSRIMDCVGCEKCRLWGKLQTRGMGTALKILLSTPKPNYLTPAGFTVVNDDFKLTRTEIVSLFNALGRLSTSLQNLNMFCNMLNKK